MLGQLAGYEEVNEANGCRRLPKMGMVDTAVAPNAERADVWLGSTAEILQHSAEARFAGIEPGPLRRDESRIREGRLRAVEVALPLRGAERPDRLFGACVVNGQLPASKRLAPRGLRQ